MLNNIAVMAATSGTYGQHIGDAQAATIFIHWFLGGFLSTVALLILLLLWNVLRT